jgi:site-specific DNA-cytosine methylase
MLISFNEKPLFKNPAPCHRKYWEMCKLGDNNGMHHPKGSLRDTYKINPNKPLKTITANPSKGRGGALHYNYFRMLTKNEVFKAQTYPLDYECKDYLCGMRIMIRIFAYTIVTAK